MCSDDSSSLPKVSKERPRVRAFSHKVRTGCITCKIRRKKCDEEKPTCRRCRNSFIKCDGYLPVPPPKKSRGYSSKSPSTDAKETPSDETTAVIRSDSRHPQQKPLDHFLPSMFLEIDGSALDKQSFHHFTNITAIDFVRIPGPNDFWMRRMLPLSHQEPAIKHAVVALGAAHRFYLNKVSTTPDDSGLELLATQHCNKAITQLRILHSDPDTPAQDVQLVTLICCLSFVCLENILGRHQEALKHMRAGARLLESFSGNPASSDWKTVMQEIATVLLRFGLDASLYAEDTVLPDLKPYAVPLVEIKDSEKPFSSLVEARDAIWDLDVRMFAHEWETEHQCPTDDLPPWGTLPDPSEDCDFDMSEYIPLYRRWKSKFDLLVADLTSPKNPPISVEVQREILVLMLRGCFWEIMISESSCRSDEMSRLYRELIDLAQLLYTFEAKSSGRPIFMLDGDSIPALMFVAEFCQDNALRQRIVELLRSFRRREGLWDSQDAADDLEKKMRELSVRSQSESSSPSNTSLLATPGSSDVCGSDVLCDEKDGVVDDMALQTQSFFGDLMSYDDDGALYLNR